jgi:hypothetical protein
MHVRNLARLLDAAIIKYAQILMHLRIAEAAIIKKRPRDTLV